VPAIPSSLVRFPGQTWKSHILSSELLARSSLVPSLSVAGTSGQCITFSLRYVYLSYCVITGAYYYFPLETLMLPLTTQYQFTLIMLNPRSRRKGGTPAPSLPLSSQIPLILLFTLSAVSVRSMRYTTLTDIIHRCSPSFHCGGV